MKFRSLIKEVVYGTAHLLGVPAVGRGLMRNGLVVLTYHSFCDTTADEHPYLNRMPITRFARQLRYLEKHYQIGPLIPRSPAEAPMCPQQTR